MKTKTSHRQSIIPTLVERGYAIHQQLALLNEEFKKIKERLKEEALAHPAEHVPLLDKDSEGKQWIALGKGCECHIVFPDAKVKSEFDPTDLDFPNIRTLAGNHFKTFFQRMTVYRPVDRKSFRSQVNQILPPKIATELLMLATTGTEPKAVWKARATGKVQI